MTFAESILSFYQSLRLDVPLPAGVEAMNPYQDAAAFTLCRKFYLKYYQDQNPRSLILGINPGRFGGGITGVPFTDPVKLEVPCGIKNDLKKKTELSADFIYAMIQAFGGPGPFYKKYYIGATSPLGFVKDGKNLNYYDIKELAKAVEPFMVRSINAQLAFGIDRTTCFCLGEGENFRYLQRLNILHGFFDRIEPLPHPRFIMQYKRKQIPHYIDEYLKKLKTQE